MTYMLCKIALNITLYTVQFLFCLFLFIMFAVQQGAPGEVGPHGPHGPRVSISCPIKPPQMSHISVDPL